MLILILVWIPLAILLIGTPIWLWLEIRLGADDFKFRRIVAKRQALDDPEFLRHFMKIPASQRTSHCE